MDCVNDWLQDRRFQHHLGMQKKTSVIVLTILIASCGHTSTTELLSVDNIRRVVDGCSVYTCACSTSWCFVHRKCLCVQTYTNNSIVLHVLVVSLCCTDTSANCKRLIAELPLVNYTADTQLCTLQCFRHAVQCVSSKRRNL